MAQTVALTFPDGARREYPTGTTGLDVAHVLAEAVQSLWPGTQVTISPVIENGFYYDFARNQPFTLEDLPVIDGRMLGRVLRQYGRWRGVNEHLPG